MENPSGRLSDWSSCEAPAGDSHLWSVSRCASGKLREQTRESSAGRSYRACSVCGVVLDKPLHRSWLFINKLGGLGDWRGGSVVKSTEWRLFRRTCIQFLVSQMFVTLVPWNPMPNSDYRHQGTWCRHTHKQNTYTHKTIKFKKKKTDGLEG